MVWSASEPEGAAQAGAVVVWSGDHPRFLPCPMSDEGLILGRDPLAELGDDRLSRQHARIDWNGARFQVADLASRNGTFVGGAPITDGEVTALPPVVVRTGRTISVLCPDVGRYLPPTADGRGPALRMLGAAAEHAARTGVLVLTGEPGVGKARLARLVCRALGWAPPALRRGGEVRELAQLAWSARDLGTAGSGGGPLVIEIAELAAALHEPLARELTRGTGAVPILLATTARDLWTEVRAGRFSPDLYRGLEPGTVHVPPLRERLEEIPWLVAEGVRGVGLPAHPSLVETCLLRPWPGNVAELLAEVSRAAQVAADAGRAAVRAEDLDPAAGRLLATGELHPLATALSPRSLSGGEELRRDDPFVTLREPTH